MEMTFRDFLTTIMNMIMALIDQLQKLIASTDKPVDIDPVIDAAEEFYDAVATTKE